MKESNQNGYAGAPDFVFDPAARIKAQEREGIAGEVMYSSYGLSLFAIEDDDLRRACFGAFNPLRNSSDWRTLAVAARSAASDRIKRRASLTRENGH